MKQQYVSLFVLVMVISLGIVYFSYHLAKNYRPSVTYLPMPSSTKINTPTVFSKSIGNAISPAGAVLAGMKTVSWQTTDYPAGVGVDINLIKKVSDSPREFETVKVIAKDTPNDGQESWVPQAGENSNDLYVEITCSNTYEFKSGCKLSGDVLKVN